VVEQIVADGGEQYVGVSKRSISSKLLSPKEASESLKRLQIVFIKYFINIFY